MKKEYKPLEKITVEPKDNFTHNGQIKSALVRISDLKAEITALKSEIERLNKRLKLFDGHLK